MQRAIATMAVALLTTAITVAASPPAVSADPRIDVSSDNSMLEVYSPSMNKIVVNRIIRANGPAPTLYLLAGIGGGEDGISWWDNTGVRAFFADKHVNVVMPIGGRFSMYTDWIADDPILGRNKWQTYLTSELPPVVDAQLGATGVNAIAGVSMSAGPALDLAIQAPDRYRAVASYSGCANTSDPIGVAMVTAEVVRGGANPVNMWGLPGSALWRAHDPFTNANRLAGKAIYLSAASGIPGEIDLGGLPAPPLEAITAACTASFSARLTSLGVAAQFVLRSEGAHTWGQFETDLRESWPLISRAIGA